MGKIIKLKNKKTGEHVYPVSVTKAIADPDSGERLNDILLNKVEEAPMDGNQYVRTNGVWSIAQMATSTKERCTINLVSNQGKEDASSIYGASVKVSDVNSGEVFFEGTWDGTEISLEFSPGVNYKIETGNIANYAAPLSKSLTALDFNVRNIEMVYSTEVVSISLSADNGESMNGQVVMINGKQHTWNGNVITEKIAYGTNYIVSVNNKVGYNAPSEQNFIASQISRNVEMVYEESPYGVFIQDKNNNMHLVEEWDGSIQANGVAVITENCSFVVGLEDASESVVWSTRDTEVPGITTVFVGDWNNDPEDDYDGEAQTTTIINYLGADAGQANACRNYTFPNGKKGYLGAAGEWFALHLNKNEVNAALTKCGGTEIPKSPYYYNTSTQVDSDEIWIYSGSNGIGYNIKKGSARARAFASI